MGEIPKTQENLTSGKIIPTGRMKPNASPPVRKVSPEFVSFETTSLEDEKSSDTNNEISKFCLDAVIDSHRRYSDSENYLKTYPYFQIGYPLSEKHQDRRPAEFSKGLLKRKSKIRRKLEP